MSTAKKQIRSALREHLLEVSGLPDDTNWEGKSFTPSVSGTDPQPYIRETILPADEVKSANGETMAIGLFEYDLIFPIGESIKEYETLADTIKEQFNPPIILDGLWIERCFIGQGDSEPPWYIIPIRGDYRAFDNTN